MKPLTLLLAVLLVAAASYLAGRLCAAPPVAAAPPPPPPTSRDMRAEIGRVVTEEVARLDSQQEVEAYLDRLVERARRGRAVTALEVEPGFAAIDRIEGDIGHEEAVRMRARFDERMLAVARETGR